MGITATILIYLLIGLEVAEAVFLADDRHESVELAFRTLTAVVFWPLYVPLLLRAVPEQPEDIARSGGAKPSNEQIEEHGSVLDDAEPATPIL